MALIIGMSDEYYDCRVKIGGFPKAQDKLLGLAERVVV